MCPRSGECADAGMALPTIKRLHLWLRGRGRRHADYVQQIDENINMQDGVDLDALTCLEQHVLVHT